MQSDSGSVARRSSAGSKRISSPGGHVHAVRTTSSSAAPCTSGCFVTSSSTVFIPIVRYRRRSRQCLAADGVETVAGLPDLAGHFGEAFGLLVKTDRAEADVLAHQRRLEGLGATVPLESSLAELQELGSKAELHQLRLHRKALKKPGRSLAGNHPRRFCRTRVQH